nr:late embryogenesis abundant protein M17-like isoform X4 [Nicotiana tomentosiformis]
MKLKTCILPLFFVLLLISYSVIATETSKDEKKANEVKETTKKEEPKETDQYGGGGRCRYGCCGGYGHYGCRRCCTPHAVVAEKDDNVVAGNRDDGYGYGYGGQGRYGYGWGGGGYGGRGGGSWGGRGGGGGGWGGGGCRYGCCGHSRYGGCRCCYSDAEAKALDENEVQP